jgi:hypothetical protein
VGHLIKITLYRTQVKTSSVLIQEKENYPKETSDSADVKSLEETFQ